jgi:pantoate--beta-alanine ligase
MPSVSGSIAGLRTLLGELRADRRRRDGEPGRVVLVPTMGALHAGHLELVEQARQLGDIVVVSIFVNPLQFGPGEDLDTYPRTLDADVAALDGLADVVFAPTVSEMYPSGPSETRVTAGPIGELFEGASRPGHFDGMLTVVAKLFHIVEPEVAVFGRKDAQQAFLVERMVRDLNFPTAIHIAQTVRDHDGLALSSRNRFLGGTDRQAAAALSRALRAAVEAAGDGDVARMLAAASAVLEREPDVRLDYLAVVDPSTFRPLAAGQSTAGISSVLMLVAARVGSTRLIDNQRIEIAP